MVNQEALDNKKAHAVRKLLKHLFYDKHFLSLIFDQTSC